MSIWDQSITHKWGMKLCNIWHIVKDFDILPMSQCWSELLSMSILVGSGYLLSCFSVVSKCYFENPALRECLFGGQWTYFVLPEEQKTKSDAHYMKGRSGINPVLLLYAISTCTNLTTALTPPFPRHCLCWASRCYCHETFTKDFTQF